MNTPNTGTSNPTFSQVLDTLTRLGCQPTRSGAETLAYCPIHEADGRSHQKSLTVREGDRVPVVVHCHAGCDSKALLNILGLHTTPPTANIPTIYSYRTAEGHEVRQKLRYKRPGQPKDFRIRHQDAGRWVYKAGTGPAVLYRLPEVKAAIAGRNTIYCCEGEKDADRLIELGLTATTNIEGAAQPGQTPKWRRDYTEQLTGAACVVLLPDNDPQGRAHMAHIGQQLIGKVQEIVVVDLGKLDPELKAKGDVSDWLDAGHTVEELLEQVARTSPPPLEKRTPDTRTAESDRGITEPSKPRFTWVQDFCALPPKQSWLIRGYLEPDTLCVLFGDSQAYKSLLAIDWACHIATGKDWRGNKVKPGIVLYLAGEGGNGLSKRFRAWFEHHHEPMKNVAISTVPLALCDPGNVDDLIADIKALLADMPEQPALIVLDTLNTHFGDGDENSTADMRKFLNGIRQLRIATGAALLVVHHVGHADKGRVRGSISLHQGVDWEYRLERTPETLTTTLTNTKSKDAEKPPVLSWNLEVVSLPWADEDGQPLNSVVLVPNDSVPTTPPVKAETLRGKLKQALDALRELYREQRETLESGGHHAEQARVSINQWNTAMQRIIEDKSYRSKIRSELAERGYVRFTDPYVYLVGHSG